MKTVLFVVSEVGYTWDEVILPLEEFQLAGFEVAIATPGGRPAQPDPAGVKCYPLLHLIGYGTRRGRSPNSPLGRALSKQLAEPLDLRAQAAVEYDALYIAGGHGALFDLHNNAQLRALIRDFYRQDKVIGALCHSSSILCEVEIDGDSLAARHRLTGFPAALEHVILTARLVDRRFLPMPLWTGRQLNHNRRRRPLWFRILEVLNLYTTVRDGQIVTGVGPKSSRRVAAEMMTAMASQPAAVAVQ